MRKKLIQAWVAGVLSLGSVGCLAVEVVAVEDEPQHKTVFENREVRVYDVNLKPGQMTDYHEHINDLLTVVIRVDAAANQKLGEEPKVDRAPVGTLIYSPYRSTGAFRHRILASEGEPFHVLGIGLKGDNRGAEKVQMGLPDQTSFRFPQGVVRRVTLQPGEKDDLAGIVIVLDQGKLSSSRSFVKPGQLWWQESEILRNEGTEDIRLLELQVDAAP